MRVVLNGIEIENDEERYSELFRLAKQKIKEARRVKSTYHPKRGWRTLSVTAWCPFGGEHEMRRRLEGKTVQVVQMILASARSPGKAEMVILRELWVRTCNDLDQDTMTMESVFAIEEAE